MLKTNNCVAPDLTKSVFQVNVMVHATDVAVPSEQVTQVRKLMEKKWSEYQEANTKNLNNKGRATVCEGESGESCNSVVVHELSGRTAVNINRNRESGSDSEASNLCSENNETVVRTFGNIQDAVDESASVSCSAEWDVFRRKDIPKLLEYLKMHSNELSLPSSVSKNVSSND